RLAAVEPPLPAARARAVIQRAPPTAGTSRVSCSSRGSTTRLGRPASRSTTRARWRGSGCPWASAPRRCIWRGCGGCRVWSSGTSPWGIPTSSRPRSDSAARGRRAQHAGADGGDPLPYIVVPALIWAALRFEMRGATLAVAVAAALAVGLTAQEVGPFVAQSISESVLRTQLYIGVAVLTTLCLAAVVSERRGASARARKLADEQAALRRVATLVGRGVPPSEVFASVAEEVGVVLGVDVVNMVRHERDETV